MIVKTVLNWLEAQFSKPQPPIEAEESHISGNTERRNVVEDDCAVELPFDAKVSGHIESRDGGKNVLKPDKHGDDYAPTVPDLKVLDRPSSSTDESTGCDPYDTADLYKK